MQVIDFTDVDMYPKNYKYDYLYKRALVRSLIIEDIVRQQDILMKKKTHLLLGDVIKVHFTFGHNIARKEKKEIWIDVTINSYFKVIKIIPRDSEIELFVKYYPKPNTN